MRNMLNRDNQKGAVVVWFSMLLIVLIGLSALAIDVGYLFAARNELQNISDSAALAGARQLGKIYQDMTSAQQKDYVLTSADVTLIKQAAINVAAQNQAGYKANIVILGDEVDIGVWQDHVFTEGLTLMVGSVAKKANAVRVFARRDNNANSPISTFFASIFGPDTATVSAFATAALTGKKTAGQGELELPVGLDQQYFANNQCKDQIKFYPTTDPDACAGWTTFTYTPANDPKIRDLLDGDLASPELESGDTPVNFTGGALSQQVFDKMLTAYQQKGYDIDANGDPVRVDNDGDPIRGGYEDTYPNSVPLLNESTGERMLYPDGTNRNKHVWDTTVIVYEFNNCDNPNQSLIVKGFAKVLVTDVLDAPDKLIKGIVDCEYVDNGVSRGDGGDFGIYGSVPGLVE